MWSYAICMQEGNSLRSPLNNLLMRMRFGSLKESTAELEIRNAETAKKVKVELLFRIIKP